MKAWAFYRRSTDMQELSIEAQRRDCRAFAEARGWEIVREFSPTKGYASGLSIERDSVFREMANLAQSSQHGVEFLLVYDVSRFGRIQPESKIYWEQHFKRNGIQLIYIKDEFRYDGSIGDTLLKVVKHSEAHQYSIKLSEVTLRGAKDHAALGHSTGGQAPYGYDRLLVNERGDPIKVRRRGEWKNTKLERVVWIPSPAEQSVVQNIFRDYVDGRGLGAIADDLNERHTPAPRGRYWSKGQLHHLLRNRSYLGERIYNKRSYKAYRRGEKCSLYNPQSAWIIKSDSHEPIVDRELFDQAQERLPKWKTRIGGAHRKRYLLAGFATCKRCGYRLVGTPRMNGKGYLLLTYICSGCQRFGRSVCQGFYLRTEALEDTAVRAIRDHLTDPAWRIELREIVAGLVKNQFGMGAEHEIAELKRQLAAIEFEISNLVDVVKGGHFSPALAEALKALETRQDGLKRSLQEAKSRLGSRMTPQRMVSEVMACADRFDAVWGEHMTPDERRETMREYIHDIRVDASSDTIWATFGLYKIPLAVTQQTRVKIPLEAISTEVNCGGPQLTCVETTPQLGILYREYNVKDAWPGPRRIVGVAT
jgi:DNA invertase Pin-like site-specific DNA recombinase